jgi:hypothetical protein
MERSDTHHLSMRAARGWVSQGLNPSCELSGDGERLETRNLYFVVRDAITFLRGKVRAC